MRLEAFNRAIWLVVLLGITAGIILFGLVNAEVRWPVNLSDSISDGLLVVAVLAWLWVILRKGDGLRPITIPLLLGGSLLFLGTVSDVLGDFFFHLPKLVKSYHYLAGGLILAGAALITAGLARWIAHTRRGAETIARLHEETQRRNEELAALNGIAATVSRSLDLNEILNSALDKVLEVMQIEAGEILLLDERSKELAICAHRGFSQEHIEGGDRIKLGEGMMGQVARSGKPMIVENVAGDPRLTRMADGRGELRSAVVVPLRAKGEMLGVMGIVSRDYRRFTPQDVQLLTSIGNQIGVAIENARLFESERKKATELEAVNQVAREIVSILDLDRLLPDVTGLINQTFGYYHVAIMLVDPTSDDLVFKVAAGGYEGRTPLGMRQKKKEGLIGWAAYLGETILVNDVSLDPRFIPAYLPETRSELDIPLKIGDRVIGVLDVQSKELNAFTEDDKRILETLADQVAVAIENAQLYEERKAQSERISALYRIDQALISTIDLERTLQLVMKEMSAAIGVNRCSLWLLDENSQAVVGTADFQPEIEKAPSIIGMKLWLSDEPMLEKVLTEGQPIVVNDVHDPAWTHLMNKEYIETFRIKSFLVVPLESKGQRKGIIVLDDSREHHSFTPDEVAMAVSAARQASIAIENARLFEETKQQLQELAMLYQVSVGIIGTLDLDEVLQLVVDSAIQAIPAAEKGALFLLDGNGNELVIRAARGYSSEVVQKVRLKVGEGYAGWAVQESQPLIVDNPEADPRAKVFSDLEEVMAIKSALVVPLEVKGQVIGALTLDNVTSYGAFNVGNLQTLSTFASQAAIAIENAELYQDQRAHAERLEEEVAARTAEIQRKQEQTEAILNSVADGLIVTDAQGRVVLANPVAEALLGFSLADLLGQRIQATTAYPHLRRLVRALTSQAAETTTVELELPRPEQPGLPPCWEQFQCLQQECPAYGNEASPCWMVPQTLCRNGHAKGLEDMMGETCPACERYQQAEKVILEAHVARILDERGEVTGTVTVLRDITRLRELDRLKSRFVSNVSHELRTPIATIKLYASLMRQAPPEKLKEHLDVLAREAERQARLVEDILQVSRIDAGRLRMNPQPTALNGLTEVAVVSHQALAQNRGLSLEHRPTQPGPVALVDTERLMQVLNNLVENAVRYTPEGGKVVVSTGKEEAEGQVWATVTVTDTGIGIPEEELPHIFDRFFRGKEPRRMQVPGSGLGLAIVKEIVELHGGRVTVESQVGVGSTFTVWLPLAD